MALSTQPYKGARDFYPEDKRIQKYMFSVLRNVVESFGYQEYDAPVLELLEIYAAKTGQEIVNEQLYSFEDKKGRQVAIRPEMTPSVSRMVAARRQELAYPLRLYSIPNLWRYERPQAGRLREHWQLNVDLFGVEAISGDVEIIAIADKILRQFGARPDMYRIEISSRKLLNELAEKTGVTDIAAFIRLVDTKNKIGPDEFHAKLKELVAGDEAAELAEHVLNLKSYEGFRSGLNFDSIDHLQELFKLLENQLGHDTTANIVFNPATARGFDYYTDIVFEVFDNHPENNRSMFGGGRYDGLVAEFGVEPVPTVGFGMGDVTLLNFLKAHNLLPQIPVETDASVILIGDAYTQAQTVITELRNQGLKLAVDWTGRKLDSQLKNAVKSGVEFVIFIGPEELEQKRFKLKNLHSGEENHLDQEQLVAALTARHQPQSRS